MGLATGWSSYCPLQTPLAVGRWGNGESDWVPGWAYGEGWGTSPPSNASLVSPSQALYERFAEMPPTTTLPLQ